MTKAQEFTLFKKECRKWIKKLELSEWRFDFRIEDYEDKYRAMVYRNLEGHVISVDYNPYIEGMTAKIIKQTAKHEMIHSLLAHFAMNGYDRHVSNEEMKATEEGLVRKLEHLIPDK